MYDANVHARRLPRPRVNVRGVVLKLAALEF
jgi:hypothetical protein